MFIGHYHLSPSGPSTGSRNFQFAFIAKCFENSSDHGTTDFRIYPDNLSYFKLFGELFDPFPYPGCF